jgi:TatA/E family protein of Tat protein translocase
MNCLPLAMIFSPWQLIVVLGLVILLFGGRVPHVMRDLGQTLHEFQKATGTDCPPRDARRKRADRNVAGDRKEAK